MVRISRITRRLRFPSRGSLAGAIVAAAWLALATTVFARPVIEESVLRDLGSSADARAHVIVILAEPAAGITRSGEEAIARLEDDVLGQLSASEFSPAYRYRNFAALTGRVSAVGLSKLASRADVLRVGSDARGSGGLATSVPFIKANAVQSLGITGSGGTVAVLDTGIDTDHPDLVDDIAPGAFHFLGGGADVGPGAEDGHGHGTNVSGIVTSRGLIAPVGVAPDADVLPVKVLDDNNAGFLSDWAAGVDYVVTHRGDYARLCAINMSLVSDATYTQCPCDAADASAMLLAQSIAAAKGAGIITFACSGNTGSTNRMTSPGCTSPAVPVAAVYGGHTGVRSWGICSDATASGDKIVCFSSRSPCNELAAPGAGIVSTGVGGGRSTFSGTSQAAPHCAGVAALMSQAMTLAGRPQLSPDDLLLFMEITGAPTIDPANTFPNPRRVDALRLYDFLFAPHVTVSAPNGGETFPIDAIVALTWNAADTVGVTRIALQVSRDGAGGPYETITASTPNTGSFLWTVTGPVTSQARLRVLAYDGAGNLALDDSDESFTIDVSTPALLSRFDLEPTAAGIELRWSLTNPATYSRVDVERAAAAEGPWQGLAVEHADAAGISIALDRSVRAGNEYFYRLIGLEASGERVTLATRSGVAGPHVADFELGEIAPNPAHGIAAIDYALPRDARVRLSVYDVLGRQVALLADGPETAGRHRASWRREGAGIGSAPPGLYFVSLDAAGRRWTRRFAVAE